MSTEFKLSYTGAQINQKLSQIDSKADKAEIPTKTSELTNDSGFLTSIPNEYVTETELDDKGYLTEHQSLEGFATETYVDNKVANIDLSDCVKNVDIFNEDNTIKQNVLPDGYPYASYDTILPETTLEVDVDAQQAVVIDKFVLAAESSYDVVYNGVVYSCVSQVVEIDGISTVALGNAVSFGGEESEEPFVLVNFDDNIAAAMGAYGLIAPMDGSETITLSISGTKVQKMSSIFMPELDVVTNIVNGSNIGSVRSLIAAKDDDEYAIGICATAFGYNTKASGDSSHAEGENTTASGDHSHAEGENTTASGDHSHAEGNGATASGMKSHAEGDGATASGMNSHAEGGYTTASGDNSHAEGRGTTASGDHSHVQGTHNIEDTNNKYAHIVGNGSNVKRSNAHTLDWDGNAWYAGDVYVGSTSGTNRDDGSKKLATEEFVNNSGFLTKHQDISGKADKSSAETWTFTLADGSTVTKKVVLA